MEIFLTIDDIISFLEESFRKEVKINYPKQFHTDTILRIDELGIHVTCDVNSGGYIDNLKMADSGESFGYYLYLDNAKGEMYVENINGVFTQLYVDYKKEDILMEIFNFLKSCNNPKLKAAIRDIQIDKILE